MTRARQETQRSLCEISLGRSEGSRRQTSAVKGMNSIAPRRGPRSRRYRPYPKFALAKLTNTCASGSSIGPLCSANGAVPDGRTGESETAASLASNSSIGPPVATHTQHATCNVQRATDDVQDATKSREVTFGSRRRCPDHATHYWRMLAASRRVPQWSDL